MRVSSSTVTRTAATAAVVLLAIAIATNTWPPDSRTVSLMAAYGTNWGARAIYFHGKWPRRGAPRRGHLRRWFYRRYRRRSSTEASS